MQLYPSEVRLLPTFWWLGERSAVERIAVAAAFLSLQRFLHYRRFHRRHDSSFAAGVLRLELPSSGALLAERCAVEQCGLFFDNF
jgi:hypothetical protein